MGGNKPRLASPVRQSPRKISSSNRQIPHSASPTTSTSNPTIHSNSHSHSASSSSNRYNRLTHRSTLSESSSIYKFPLPPPFEFDSRYAPSNSTGYSPVPVPYRPGDYGRLERGSTSDRTEVVGRKLFDEEEEEAQDEPDDEAEPGDSASVSASGNRNHLASGLGVTATRGSSPLAPPFEAKMVLRNGASVDLMSWLRTNFHYISHHSVLTPSISLIGIRALLLERFPRVPELSELAKAVSVAFPHSTWDYPTGAYSHHEPPMIKGLVWHGTDVEDDTPDRYKSRATNARARPHALASGSRSPTQSTLISPTSSSARKHLPDTPARSVLEEFAEIASLAEKTPVSQVRSLPGEVVAPAPAFALANLCNSFADGSGSGSASASGSGSGFGTTATGSGSLSSGNGGRKRKFSTRNTNYQDYDRSQRASTPDKLQGLIAAAEAVEGSPINSFLYDRGSFSNSQQQYDRDRLVHAHKRRRTIGGDSELKEVASRRRNRSLRASGGTVSPTRSGLELFPIGEDSHHVDMLVPLNDVDSPPGGRLRLDEDAVSTLTPSKPTPPNRDLTSSTSTTSTTSSISHTLPSLPTSGQMTYPNTMKAIGDSPTPISQPLPPHLLQNTSTSTSNPNTSSSGNMITKQPKRKVNELPTTGLAPGIDCKPPYPYHELIRHAIENSPEGKLQLSQIYASIAERFPFFATLNSEKTSGWQNSIRHNLSLKKMFVRVNKPDTALFPDENGKGGWWTVQPGIPDEGRPGRKSKTKEKGSGSVAGGSVLGQEDRGGEEVIGGDIGQGGENDDDERLENIERKSRFVGA